MMAAAELLSAASISNPYIAFGQAALSGLGAGGPSAAYGGTATGGEAKTGDFTVATGGSKASDTDSSEYIGYIALGLGILSLILAVKNG